MSHNMYMVRNQYFHWNTKFTNINKVDMFHSETTNEKKSDIIKKLYDGDSDLKLLIATFALGMGIDIANCSNFIWYTIYNNRLQEVGRIGRDGKESIALLLYNKHHMQYANVSIKHIYTTQSCRRASIMKDFLSTSEIDSLNTGIIVVLTFVNRWAHVETAHSYHFNSIVLD